MSSEKGFADRVLGKLYGFPQCCVDFYVSASSAECHQAPGTAGLRFCPSCATKDLELIIQGINERRINPQPFPISPKEEDYRTIIEDQRFTEDERVWLLANKKRVVPEADRYRAALITLHDALQQLEDRTAANIAEEPHREKYFIAMQEIAKDELMASVLNGLFIAMRKRVLEQIEGGYIDGYIALPKR